MGKQVVPIDFVDRGALTTGIRPISVIAADLNSDGALDLASADFGPFDDRGLDELSIFLGLGDGDFSQRRALKTGDAPFSVIAADLNSDGALDLASADRLSDELSIFFGLGDDDFSERRALKTAGGPVSVIAADLNSDGALDLASADSVSIELSIFLGGVKVHRPGQWRLLTAKSSQDGGFSNLAHCR